MCAKIKTHDVGRVFEPVENLESDFHRQWYIKVVCSYTAPVIIPKTNRGVIFNRLKSWHYF